jgi:hypothetical protein
MASPDLQALVDSLLPFAQSRLNEFGEFHAFGALMASDGEIRWIAADVGEEFPAGQLLIDTMTETLKAMAASGSIRATAICYDARTNPPGQAGKTDVIAFSLEHWLGESLSVFFPYRKGSSGGTEYGSPFAVEKTPQIFLGPAVGLQ